MKEKTRETKNYSNYRFIRTGPGDETEIEITVDITGKNARAMHAIMRLVDNFADSLESYSTSDYE